MSVLGTLAKRLQTDIADTARAAVDPVFSRQLTQANFQKDRDDRQRRQALEDVARVRQQQVADEENKQRTTMHMKLVEDAISTIKVDGNREPLLRIMSSQGLTPVAQEWAVRTINANVEQGMAGVKAELEIKRIKQSMSTERKRLVMEQTRIDNQVDQALQDDLRADGKIAYEQFIDAINAEQSTMNRNSFLDHIEANEWMFTKKELEAARNIMRNGDEGQIKLYWTELWNQANNRLAEKGKDARAAQAAKASGQLPSAVNNSEFREASVILSTQVAKDIEDNPQLKDLLEESLFEFDSTTERKKESRIGLVFAAARIAKTHARDIEKGASEGELFAAYDLAKGVGLDEVDGKPAVNVARVISVAKEITDAGITIEAVVKLANLKEISIFDAMTELGIR